MSFAKGSYNSKKFTSIYIIWISDYIKTNFVHEDDKLLKCDDFAERSCAGLPILANRIMFSSFARGEHISQQETSLVLSRDGTTCCNEI